MSDHAAFASAFTTRRELDDLLVDVTESAESLYAGENLRWDQVPRARAGLALERLAQRSMGSGPLLARVLSAARSLGVTLKGSVLKAARAHCVATRDAKLLEALWQATVHGDGGMPPQLLKPYFQAAFEFGKPELQQAVLDVMAASAGKLDVPTLSSVAFRSGQLSRGDTVEVIWRAIADRTDQFATSHWGRLAKAMGLVTRNDLFRDLWERWKGSGASLGPIGWVSMVFACGRVGAADLLPEMWTEVQNRPTETDAGVWSAFGDAAARLGLRPFLRDLWQQTSEKKIGTAVVRSQLRAAEWGSLANAAGLLRDQETLIEIWQACQPRANEFNSATIGTFAKAFGNLRNGEHLAELWQLVRAPLTTEVARRPTLADGLESTAMATLAGAAAATASAQLLREVTQLAIAAPKRLDARAWGAFAIAAGRMREMEAFDEIRRASLALQPRFQRQEWISFLLAAGRADSPERLQSVWAESQSHDAKLRGLELAKVVKAALAVRAGDVAESANELLQLRSKKAAQSSLERIARAAAARNDQDLMRHVMETLERNPAAASVHTWFLLRGRFWEAAIPDLTDRLWQAALRLEPHGGAKVWRVLLAGTEAKVERFEALQVRMLERSSLGDIDTLTALALCSGASRRPQAVQAVWKLVSKLRPLPRALWMALLQSAGEVREGEILHELWDRVRDDTTDLPRRAWCLLIRAAGRLGDGAWLEDLWTALAPHRTRLWAGTDGAPLDSQVWVAMISTLGTVIHPRLLESVATDLFERRDAVRNARWASLGPPLRRAAERCGDPDLRTMIVETMRGQRADVSKFLDELVHSEPVPVGAPGARFEGAARCITKWLVAPLLLEPEAFGSRARRVTEAVCELPRDRQQAFWIAFLGRGHGAFLAVLKDRYTDEQHRVSLVPATPWEQRSPEDQQKFLDLVAGDGAGELTARIAELLGREQSLPQRYPARWPGEEFLSEVLAENRRALLDGSNRNTPEDIARHFGRIDSALIAVGAIEWSPGRWAETLGVLLEHQLVLMHDALQPRLNKSAHDVKNLIRNVSTAIREKSPDDPARLVLAREIYEALQQFRLALDHIGVTQLSPVEIHLGKLVRRLYSPWPREYEMELSEDTNVLVRSAGSAKKQLLNPLLIGIRSEAELALQQLDPARRRLICRCVRDGTRVRFSLENTFDSNAAPNAYSNGLGRLSIMEKVLAVGGEIVPPFPEVHEGDEGSWWRVQFWLPSAKPAGEA